MGTYRDYHDARAEAQRRANSSGLDVAIRKGQSVLDRGVFYVSYAAVNDSDYARAEIVRPDPADRRIP